MPPTLFDWMVWFTTLCAIIVPVWITTVLWRRDHRKSEYREQERALRDLVRQLQDLDGDKLALIKFGYMSEFMEAYGGAVAIVALVDKHIDGHDPESGGVDISIDVGMLVRSWRGDGGYRADSAELIYVRPQFSMDGSENAELSPEEIVKAESFILQDKRIHPWLAGTRLSVWRIRRRRVIRWLRAKARLAPIWHTDNIMTLGNEMAFPKQQDTPCPL